jgi:hypothetical protein
MRDASGVANKINSKTHKTTYLLGQLARFHRVLDDPGASNVQRHQARCGINRTVKRLREKARRWPFFRPTRRRSSTPRQPLPSRRASSGS